MQKILTICSQGELGGKLAAFLDRRGYRVRGTGSAAAGLEAHRNEGADLVLTCLPLPDVGGAELLGRLLAQDPRGIVVVCGKDVEIAGAPDALDLGAFDFISDPLRDTERLLSIIGIGLGARKSDAQLRYLRKKDASDAAWQTIVGRSPVMRQVAAMVRQICHRTTSGAAPTILVTGETGTGKGLIAKAVHYNGARRSGAFVDINCAAIPRSLIEAELFGHTRGAFTDAKAGRAGLFETADGGTLFLDEIGMLPIDLQGKLLTALEEKVVRRIGAGRGVPVDVQVIAATHTDLESAVERSEFRLDLYHRLNVIRIDLPPLRQRGGDSVLLAEAFIEGMCREYGIPTKQLHADARAAITRHSWPGNVRELRNQLERVILLEDGEMIRSEHLTIGPRDRRGVEVRADAGELRITLPEESCPLELLERSVIKKALEKHRGNVSRTARYLEITRHTLIYRLKKHGIER